MHNYISGLHTVWERCKDNKGRAKKVVAYHVFHKLVDCKGVIPQDLLEMICTMVEEPRDKITQGLKQCFDVEGWRFARDEDGFDVSMKTVFEIVAKYHAVSPGTVERNWRRRKSLHPHYY